MGQCPGAIPWIPTVSISVESVVKKRLVEKGGSGLSNIHNVCEGRIEL